ncbi:MAG: NAD(P)-binding protein [Peptostreptococcus anaerobius]|uniref:NAD(P)-binding protein n=1 Tax=Peptostreptococcus anaerobius TaxID=1261 RepID=UPI00290EDCE1|nr:NAD(P)-binding protein [Peptostreptococcus anaerobius]MDU5096055.1 NAD(P)-binding protein [Peptostreptococcus anaerobius]
MSRLYINTPDTAQVVVEGLYKDMERRIMSSPPGICPIDISLSFLSLCHAQTCGKCVPCRIGLGKLKELMEKVLSSEADESTIDLIEETSRVIMETADCAIGTEAAEMVLKGVMGFRDDYLSHIRTGNCSMDRNISVPCVALCPAGVDIPGYMALVGEGRYKDAVRLVRKDNPFTTACALVCEHPCEARCRRTMVDAPMNIRGIKLYAADHAGEVPPPKPAKSTNKKVAVVGGGPSGLSAAYYLSLMGHKVSVYEAKDKLGGMLRYGIPNYRLPRKRLQEDIDAILATGIEVHTNVEIGKDFSVEDLSKKFDAVYIAIGAHDDKKLGLDGENSKGVTSAVEMLKNIGDEKYPDFTGKKVVVIGGGNVAMDVARTAIRCKADKVSIVYRRRQEDMTCLPEEVEGAIAEGCQLVTLMAPIRIEADKDNNTKAIWVQPQMISTITNGRAKPINSSKKEERIECDQIIVAIGQNIGSNYFKEFGMPVKKGIIEALNSSEVKNIPGVFAGGDCVTGPATVIKAIGAGKVAAANIDEYLGFNHMISVDVEIPKVDFKDKKACARSNMREVPIEIRKNNFEEIELGLTREETEQEVSRCLRCDHFGWGNFRGGRTLKW